jgi:hypothetical protein
MALTYSLHGATAKLSELVTLAESGDTDEEIDEMFDAQIWPESFWCRTR